MKRTAISIILIVVICILQGCSPSKSIFGEYQCSIDKYHPYYLKLNSDSTFLHYPMNYSICSFGRHNIPPVDGHYYIKADTLYLKYKVREPRVEVIPYDSLVYYTDTTGLSLSKILLLEKPAFYPADSLGTETLFLHLGQIYKEKKNPFYKHKYTRVATNKATSQ